MKRGGLLGITILLAMGIAGFGAPAAGGEYDRLFPEASQDWAPGDVIVQRAKVKHDGRDVERLYLSRLYSGSGEQRVAVVMDTLDCEKAGFIEEVQTDDTALKESAERMEPWSFKNRRGLALYEQEGVIAAVILKISGCGVVLIRAMSTEEDVLLEYLDRIPLDQLAEFVEGLTG